MLVHNLKTHLFTSRGSLQLLKIFFRATVLIRLALTSEASSPLSDPSTPTHPDWNSRLSAQNLSFTFLIFFCQQHKNGSKLAEQQVGARRQRWVDQRCDSSSSGWGWVRSCSVFHRLLAGSSSRSNVSSRSVSVEEANEKVSVLSTLMRCSSRAPGLRPIKKPR